MLLLLVTACETGGSLEAYCRGSEAATDALASAILADGGDQSAIAAANSIAQRDAVCAPF